MASPRHDLAEFLAAAFSLESLERFVTLTLDLPELAGEIEFKKLNSACFQVVRELDRYGYLVGSQVFAALLEERGHRKSEILAIQRAFVDCAVPSHVAHELEPAQEVIRRYGQLSRAHRRAVRSELRLDTKDPIVDWGRAVEMLGENASPDGIAATVNPARVWATMLERFPGRFIEVHRMVEFVQAHRLRLYARVLRTEQELEFDPEIVRGEPVPMPSDRGEDLIVQAHLPPRAGEKVQVVLCAEPVSIASVHHPTLSALQLAGGFLLDTAGFGPELV